MSRIVCKFHGSICADVCKAGILVSSVTPRPNDSGAIFRRPCVVFDPYNPADRAACEALRRDGPAGSCSWFAALTAEEVAARENHRASLEALLASDVAPEIERFKAMPKALRHEMSCPACASGRLVLSRFSWALNSVAGRCSSPGCFDFHSK